MVCGGLFTVTFTFFTAVLYLSVSAAVIVMTVEPKPLRLTTPADDTSATDVLLLEYVRVPSAEALRLKEPSFNSLTKLSAAALIVCSALFTVTVTFLDAALYLSVSVA